MSMAIKPASAAPATPQRTEGMAPDDISRIYGLSADINRNTYAVLMKGGDVNVLVRRRIVFKMMQIKNKQGAVANCNAIERFATAMESLGSKHADRIFLALYKIGPDWKTGDKDVRKQFCRITSKISRIIGGSKSTKKEKVKLILLLEKEAQKDKKKIFMEAVEDRLDALMLEKATPNAALAAPWRLHEAGTSQ